MKTVLCHCGHRGTAALGYESGAEMIIPKMQTQPKH